MEFFLVSLVSRLYGMVQRILPLECGNGNVPETVPSRRLNYLLIRKARVIAINLIRFVRDSNK